MDTNITGGEMMAETDNQTTGQSGETSKERISNDELIRILTQLTATDVEKLEQMARGEFPDDPRKDEKLLGYLRVVSSLFGSNNFMFSNDGPQTRQRRYETYDEMEDTVAYVSSALDILSDDATQPDEDGVVIHVRSSNSKVQTLTEKLIIDLELQERISKWARVVAKYGDFFVGATGEQNEGITRINDLHYPGHIERKEVDGELAAFVDTMETDPEKAIKAPWEFIHFRHKGDIYRKREQSSNVVGDKAKYKLSGSYGQSVLQPAIKVYTQLRFVENMIILSRMTNSIRRNIFMINVGDVSPDKSIETVQLYANLLKKDITLDLDKGIYDAKKQTVKYDEDIFLPVGDARNDIRVETVGGDVNISEQYDLEYLLNKLFAALKIPKAYLNYEQDLNARSTLIQLDIRYARSVARLQQTLIGGLVRLAKINLAYHGIDATTADLEITLSTVSSIEAEIRRQESEQNLNNVRSFVEVMGSLKTAIAGEGGGEGHEGETPAPAASPVNMEYAAYYAAKEFLNMKEEHIEKLFTFDIKQFQDAKQQELKNQSESLREHKVYQNSDGRAPLPMESDRATFDQIRETISQSLNTEVHEGEQVERIR